MKILISILLTFNVYASEQVMQHGSHNVTNICQPKMVVKTCKKTCNKPKVVYKTKYKTKVKTLVKMSKPKVVTKNRYFRKKSRKNRLQLLGGYGPTGVSLSTSNKQASVYEEKGLVLGIQYTRKITERLNIAGQVQNNETYLLGVGVDF